MKEQLETQVFVQCERSEKQGQGSFLRWETSIYML